MVRSKLCPKQLSCIQESNSQANLILFPLSVLMATSLVESIPHSANDALKVSCKFSLWGLQTCSWLPNNGFVGSIPNQCNEKLIVAMDNFLCSFEGVLYFLICSKQCCSEDYLSSIALLLHDDESLVDVRARETSENSSRWCKCKCFIRLLVLPNFADAFIYGLNHSNKCILGECFISVTALLEYLDCKFSFCFWLHNSVIADSILLPYWYRLSTMTNPPSQ